MIMFSALTSLNVKTQTKQYDFHVRLEKEIQYYQDISTPSLWDM